LVLGCFGSLTPCRIKMLSHKNGCEVFGDNDSGYKVGTRTSRDYMETVSETDKQTDRQTHRHTHRGARNQSSLASSVVTCLMATGSESRVRTAIYRRSADGSARGLAIRWKWFGGRDGKLSRTMTANFNSSARVTNRHGAVLCIVLVLS